MVSRAIVLFLGGILGAAAMFCFMVTPCEGKDDLSLSPPLDGAMEPPAPTDLPQTKVKMVKGWSDIPGSGNGVIPISFCQVEIEGKVATIVDAEDVSVVYPPVP